MEDKNAASGARYEVAPGITLFIRDIRTKVPENGGEAEEEGLIEINYCTAGRFEYFYNAGTRVLLGEGDMSVNRTENTPPGLRSFPSGFYRGVELLIRPDEATAWYAHGMGALGLDFGAVADAFLGGRYVRFGKAPLKLGHIFRELYAAGPETQLRLLRLKVPELMLALEDGIAEREQDYLPLGRANLARHLRDHLTGPDAPEFSLKAIAAEHGLSVAQAQRIFKAVYGQPMYAYFRQYRLERAAETLANTALPVSEAARQAGYATPEKFAAAFKGRFGVTPTEYRRRRMIIKE